MSGIFKGDSIYKSGGGGGGFKDGGQLVDGDFIKVENNTVSSYDNVSRDPVNFYFEVKDGEILNSVVELTTAVNATINVYVVKNGFYYLLGNVGGNTVNAGDDYKLNVTGDSYSLEQVTPGGGNIPSFVTLGGVIYQVKEYNGYLWTLKNLEGDFGIEYMNVPEDGTIVYFSSDKIYNCAKCGPDWYYRIYGNVKIKIDNACSPFRVPSHDDFVSSGLSSLNCSELTSDESNTSGFSALDKRSISGGTWGGQRFMKKDINGKKWAFAIDAANAYRYDTSNTKPFEYGLGDNYAASLRLCCKITDL